MKAFNKNAQYFEDKRLERIRQGETEAGSQVAGLRLLKHLTANGGDLPCGSTVSTEFGEMKLYGDVFGQIVKEHKERKKQIEDIVEAFLDCGTDELIVNFWDLIMTSCIRNYGLMN